MLNSGLNFIAGGDISKGALLKLDSTNPENEVVVCAGNDDRPVAVATCDVDISEDAAADLKYVPLVVGAIYDLIAGAAISKGAELMPHTASGRVVTNTATHHAHFIAVQAASGAGVRLQARYIGPVYKAS